MRENMHNYLISNQIIKIIIGKCTRVLTKSHQFNFKSKFRTNEEESEFTPSNGINLLLPFLWSDFTMQIKIAIFIEGQLIAAENVWTSHWYAINIRLKPGQQSKADPKSQRNGTNNHHV